MPFSIRRILLLITTLAATSTAIPPPVHSNPTSIVQKDNCAHQMRSCFHMTCNPKFPTPDAVHGRCTGGAYRGCPCDKCGSGHGYIGFCGENGCQGRKETCTAGRFQGCPCTENRNSDDYNPHHDPLVGERM